jgi:cell wall-associated NlpC family hydrolase
MLKRFAPLVPLTLALLFSVCANAQVKHTYNAPHQRLSFALDAEAAAKADETSAEQQLLDGKPYELPSMKAVLERGFSLIGTRYRPGGTSTVTGFDCSGFINYVFLKETGIKLPRSTRDLINMPVPKVARHKLQPGDLVFFATKGRGRVNHAGIYIGDGEFIHSSSTRSGGVRVDKLASDYWNSRYLLAKRVVED